VSALDRLIALTLFRSQRADQKEEIITTLRDFGPVILRVTKPSKGALPWLKLATFGDARTEKNSFRHDANVLAITGIEADYDHEVMHPNEAAAVLRGANLAAMIYGSPRHSEDAPRWRVLCPVSETLPPASRRHLVERLNGLFHGALSRESFTLSQSYYYGSVKNNPSHFVDYIEGDYIDLRADLDADAMGPPQTEYKANPAPPPRRTRNPSAFVETVIRNAIGKVSAAPDGQKHHTLRAQARLLGGYMHVGGYGVGEMAQQLVAALPASVRDRKAALATAIWGIEHGATKPIEIPEMQPRHVTNGHTEPNGHTTISEDEWSAIINTRTEEPEPDWDWGKIGATGPAIKWPVPLDIFNANLETPPPQVTSDHIPERLWPFVYDTSLRMGVDPTTVALAVLVTCASVIHENWCLQPKRYDKTWTENARLWGCIVGDPSTLKSPVIMAATRIINRLEAEARRRHQDEMAVYEKALAVWKKQKDTDEPPPVKPKLTRYLVEGATMEAFQEVLRDDPKAGMRAMSGKVLCRQDEMSEWAGNLDRYSGGRGGDRGAYLRLYNGGPYTVDRIQRGSFSVANWSACFITGCQPEPIQKIAKEAAEDGLLQRFVYAVPAPAGEGLDQPEDEAAIDAYHETIRALTAMQPLSGPDGYGHERVVFHDLAHIHREEIDKAARSIAAIPDTSNRVRSTLGKWPGLFARLCLTFHLIEHAGERIGFRYVISEPTAERAKNYMLEVILPHMIRADLMMFLTPQSGHARWIAGYILAHGCDVITSRHIVQAYRALRSAENVRELRETMASLVTIGWLDPMEPKNPLNPVSSWRVNPAVHIRFAEHAAQEAENREATRRAVFVASQKYAPIGFTQSENDI
jgi:hypothetical protein